VSGRTRALRRPITITFDGTALTGEEGQSIAGVLLGNAIVSWRDPGHTGSTAAGRPAGPQPTGEVDASTSVAAQAVQTPLSPGRGVFCGIGVCFDCVVVVGERRDVRACRRRARDGDVVSTQRYVHGAVTPPGTVVSPERTPA
jgi:hypothetical protein